MSAAGTWDISIPLIHQDYVLVLNAAGGGKLTGTMVEAGGDRPNEIKNGSETGNRVHWEVTTPFAAKFGGEVDGNKIKGGVQSPLGNAPFHGTRR